MEIKKEIFKELTGFDFDSTKCKGLTRDNKLFWIFEASIKDEANKIIIDENEGRYTLTFIKENERIIKSNNVVFKAIASKIADLALFSSNEELIKLKNYSSTDREAIKHLLSKEIDIQNEIKAYKDLMLRGNKDMFSNKLKEWKSFNNVKNSYLSINTRMKTIIAKNVFDWYGIEISGSNYDQLNKNYKVNYQALIDLTNKYMDVFISDNTDIHKQEQTQILTTIKDIPQDTGIKNEDNNILDNDFYSLTFLQINDLVKNQILSIPAFQRDYVWDRKKVIPFLNSLKNNYPIGSILVSDSTYALEGKNQVFKILKRPISLNNMNKQIVLDGQQRITTMLMILNIKELNQRKIDFDSHTQKKIQDISKIYFYKENFCDQKALKAIGLTKKELHNYLIIRQDIFEQMKKVISSYKVPFIKTINWDKDNLSEIIKIFESINTGGTNLTNVDLVHTALYDKDNRFELLDFLKKIKESDKCSYFNMDDKSILQIAKIHYDTIVSGNDLVDISESSILELSLSKDGKNYITSIKQSVAIIERMIYFWNTKYGITRKSELKNIAFIMNICGMIIKREDYSKNFAKISFDGYDEIVRSTLFKSLLGSYSSGTASKVNDDIKKIMSDYTIDLDYEENKNSIKESLINNIKRAAYNDTNIIYSFIVGILSLKQPISLINGRDLVIANTISKWETQDKDQHHFVPKKNKEFAKSFGENINHFENIFIISSEENRNEIKAHSPFKYLLSEFRNDENIETKIANIAESHFLANNDVKSIISGASLPIEEKEHLLKRILKDRRSKILQCFYKKFNIDFL